MIVLAVIESEFGAIEVLQRRRSGSLVYRQAGSYQSEADLGGASLASYVHAIYDLVLQGNARNILVIGCGGGTLATMLARAGRDVTLVDIDPASFAIARKYFQLPATVACRVSDGKFFLKTTHTLYDAIVADAYHGSRVPAHLESPRFFDLVRQRLSAKGAVFANIHLQDDLDQHADQTAARMAKVWSEVRILDSEGSPDRNAIVMGGAVGQLQAPTVTVLPVVDAGIIERELLSMKFRPCRVDSQA